MPGTKLQEHTGSDKAWVWSAVDFAEEKQEIQMFCVRFGSVESEWGGTLVFFPGGWYFEGAGASLTGSWCVLPRLA